MPGVPSPTMEADSPSPRSNSIGGYIAAVVACLLVATLLAAATVFIVKRRRRKQRANSIGGHDIKNRNGGRAGTNDVPTRSTQGPLFHERLELPAANPNRIHRADHFEGTCGIHTLHASAPRIIKPAAQTPAPDAEAA